MKSLFVGIVTAFFASMPLAYAQEGSQDLNFSEYRKFLMNGESSGAGKKLAIQTTCTTSAGQTYRVGDSGYDSCLASLKTQQDMKPRSGDKNAPVPETGATTTIHFGN